MARRHLTMSPAEWDGLPWWQQQMYVEGYEWEGLIERGFSSDDPTVVSQTVRREGNTTITDTVSAEVLDLTPGAFGSYGIAETTMTME